METKDCAISCNSTKNKAVSDDEMSDSGSEWEDCDDVNFKMVFIVNTHLRMGVGKIASQVGHAAVGLYKLLKHDLDKYSESLHDWECTGERKITLRGKDAEFLTDLQVEAEKHGLPTYLVEDAGHTQIPEGATTVLGIFGNEDDVNEVTGTLRLL